MSETSKGFREEHYLDSVQNLAEARMDAQEKLTLELLLQQKQRLEQLMKAVA